MDRIEPKAVEVVIAKPHQSVVDEELAQLQVARIVGTYAVGNLLNAKTGRSQLLGGIVGGIGMALFEQSLSDPNDGRFINNNLSEYLVHVNADIETNGVSSYDVRRARYEMEVDRARADARSRSSGSSGGDT